MKVRCIEVTDPYLTKSRKYKVISECERYYIIKDDVGDEVSALKLRFEEVPSKKLKVGGVLLAKDLTDWCSAGENYHYSEWRTSTGYFSGDRTIEEIEVKDGHKAFLVSDTAGAWIRAKGYRKFCERNVEPIVTVNSPVVVGDGSVMLGSNNRLIEKSENEK